MAFIVFDWLEEPNAKELLQKIDQALEELSELLKEVAPTGSAPRLMPKVVWKIRSFLQGLACRQLSLSRAAELYWNNGELLDRDADTIYHGNVCYILQFLLAAEASDRIRALISHRCGGDARHFRNEV